MLYSNRFVEIVVYFKWLCPAGKWKSDERLKKKFSLKRKTQRFSVSHSRQAKLHAPRQHTQSYKARALGNQCKQFQRHHKMASVWLTFGVPTAVSRAVQEIWCIPKWRDRSLFCTSQVHLVNSWDVQIIINKFRDVLRILILILYKHGVCVLAYFSWI